MAKEIPHNSPEQVRGILDEALTIVRELEIEDELRLPAFTKACDLRAAKQIFYTDADAMAGNVLGARILNERRH